MYNEVFPKILNYSDEKYGSYRLLEKKTFGGRVSRRASSMCQSARMRRPVDESDMEFMVKNLLV